MIPLFLLATARHAQCTQNDKFAISLQYLNKEGRDEFDFLHAGKYLILLQVEAITFVGKAIHTHHTPNKFAKSLQHNI